MQATTSDERAGALGTAIDLVDEFFDGVFAPLNAWLPNLQLQIHEQLASGGSISGLQLAGMVENDVRQILDTRERPLYGAGYCASDSVVTEGNPLAWWQGPERSLLGASMFGPGQAAIDLFRLEWFRIPEATRQSHVAGPFVDYLCSNEITITAAVPVAIEGEFAGVICADVLVSSLEEVLLPKLAELTDATLVNAGGRVVVSTDVSYETGDRYAGFAAGQSASHAAPAAKVVTSPKYPFSLVSSG